MLASATYAGVPSNGRSALARVQGVKRLDWERRTTWPDTRLLKVATQAHGALHRDLRQARRPQPVLILPTTRSWAARPAWMA